MKLCISSENCMVIDQIVAELRYIQKEPKITNFASSTTLKHLSKSQKHLKRSGTRFEEPSSVGYDYFMTIMDHYLFQQHTIANKQNEGYIIIQNGIRDSGSTIAAYDKK